MKSKTLIKRDRIFNDYLENEIKFENLGDFYNLGLPVSKFVRELDKIKGDSLFLFNEEFSEIYSRVTETIQFIIDAKKKGLLLDKNA